MQDFEKLGAFYLGRPIDPGSGEPRAEPLLYDSRDLTTHAVIVGMTGSGKTGLGIGLIEEAALDRIPVLAIDPKGDLGNLLLTFPELAAADFAPWVDPSEAARRGRTLDEQARATAEGWREGLAEWGQEPARIARLREAADFTIYTPGSDAGVPLAILRSFDAPPAAEAAQQEAWAERLTTAVAALLSMIGEDPDPLQSRAHVLLANVVDHEWRAGRSVDLLTLVRLTQSPPFDRIGALDVDTFLPPGERTRLATRLNAVLASPGFALWRSGEPLDVQRLLWTADGRPRVSIVSIAHLADAERMLVVTLLLEELIAWMRRQSGTGSLRALLYVDEVFGYLPPVANPPSKTPLLTLLKQARAFGVGCVLATQNPVDLDYKALSNAGTWFLGRLQTERDLLRLVDGLEGAAASPSSDRAELERTIAGLGQRTFLMHDVHEDGPVLFRTRQALSYLRGPLTRAQIATLTAPRRAALAAAEPDPATGASRAAARSAHEAGTTVRPALGPGVVERFLPPLRPLGNGETLRYRPALYAAARLHFVARAGVDLWRDAQLVTPLAAEPDADPWDDEGCRSLERAPVFAPAPEPEASYEQPPAAVLQQRSWVTWTRRLEEHLYRTAALTIRSCEPLDLRSEPGESERDFVARCTQAAREARDRRVADLEDKYAPRFARLRDAIRRSEERLARERSEARHESTQTMISIGATLIGALFGRRRTTGLASAARSASRGRRAQDDVARAEQAAERARAGLAELERELQDEVAELRRSFEPDRLVFDAQRIAPRKSDLVVHELALLWTPWALRAGGGEEPLAGDAVR